MFKLSLALAFGLVAAFAIGLAGLLADVGLAAVLLRCFAGFLLAGLLSYLVAFVLEAKEWADFNKTFMSAPPQGEEESLSEEEGADQEEETGAPAEEEPEEGGFTPFPRKTLIVLSPPDDSLAVLGRQWGGGAYGLE